MRQINHQIKIHLTLEFNTTEEDSDAQFTSASNTIESVLGEALYILDGRYGILTTEEEWQ
jgi:hypothetical protein